MAITTAPYLFTKKEVTQAFTQAQLKGYYHGLKLLEAPLNACTNQSNEQHGKLLIVTPRAAGKAHDRNLIRRRVKAIFYTEKLYQKPVIWILLVRSKAIDLDFDRLKAFLVHHMRVTEVKPS